MNNNTPNYDVETIYNDGKYYPSRPGAMTDAEIEQEMLNQYLRSHPEMNGEELTVIRGMGVMDDEQGNIYEPFAIGRRRENSAENRTDSSESTYNSDVVENTPSVVTPAANINEPDRAEDSENIDDLPAQDDVTTNPIIEPDNNTLGNTTPVDNADNDSILEGLEEALANEDIEELIRLRNLLDDIIYENQNDQVNEFNPEETRIEAEVIDNAGKYYPSRPGALTDEEIEQEMMEDYRRRNNIPNDADLSDLEIVRGMGAMDDEQGNIYEPYSVVRKKKEPNEKTLEEPEPVPVLPSPDPVPVLPSPDPEKPEEKDEKDESDEKEKEEEPIKGERSLAAIETFFKEEVYGDEKDKKSYKEIRNELISRAKLSDAFKGQLKKGAGVGYFVGSIIPAGLEVLKTAVGKIYATYASLLKGSGKGSTYINRFEKAWEDLSPAEIEKLWNHYLGNEQLKMKELIDIDSLIRQKLVAYGMEKVAKLNQETEANYAILITAKATINDIDRKLQNPNLSAEERAQLIEQRNEFVRIGGTAAKTITDCQREANKILNSGIHGHEEDTNAKQSKMNFAGFRHSKIGDVSVEEQKIRYGNQGDRYDKALERIEETDQTKDYEELMDSFLEMEYFLIDHTDSKKIIGGTVSTGATEYSPFAKRKDYRPDPYIRNMLITATTLASIVSIANSIRVELKNKELKSDIEEVNLKNEVKVEEMREAARHQLEQQERLAKGSIARARENAGGYHGISERRALDTNGKDWYESLTSSDYSKNHNITDHDIQEAIAREASDRSSTLLDQYTRGEITQRKFLESVQEVEKFTVEATSELAKDYIPGLAEYMRNHPNFELAEFYDTIQFISKSSGDVIDSNVAILEIMKDADFISQVTIQGAPSDISSDLITTIIAATGAPIMAAQALKDGGFTPDENVDGKTQNLREALIDLRSSSEKKLDIEEELSPNEELNEMVEEDVESVIEDELANIK